MRIGILGSGLMGGKLGTLFVRAGHHVVLSYSHSRSKLDTLASDAGTRAQAGTPREAVEEADVLLLAVHWNRVDDVLKQAGDLTGKVMISCGDDARAKKTAATLIRDVGFDPMDLGPLEMARHTEPFTMLVAKLAYEGDTGPAIAYRFEEYEKRE